MEDEEGQPLRKTLVEQQAEVKIRDPGKMAELQVR